MLEKPASLLRPVEPADLMTTVAIIDYGLGNVRSVANALEAIGGHVQITNRKEDLAAADRLILPGVGAFEDGMANLQRLGLVPILRELVLEQKKPFLGICLGMQLLATTGYENGTFPGLGWIEADVVRLSLEQQGLKVPHVGWNNVTSQRDNALLGQKDIFHSYYFVHSYHMVCADADTIIGATDYGIDLVAALQQENIFATQFHPEKSQRHGLNLLRNFLNYSTQVEEAPVCLKIG